MSAVEETIPTGKWASMEVQFPPDWRVLRDLRAFVDNLVLTVANSSSLAERVSMVVTELAENAVKYADSSSATVRLKVQPTPNGVRCETENDARADDIAELERLLKLVNQGDSLEVYVNALIAACEDEDGLGSKVGLARIRHEGQMTLNFEVQKSRVRIIAETAA